MSTTHWFWLVVALNLICKLWAITENDVAHDEPFSIYFAQLSPTEIVRELKNGNNPLLYELILHFWTRLAGLSPLAVRLPSALAVCLSVGFMFLFLVRYVRLSTALVGACVLSCSSFYGHFAHEARAYAFIGLFGSLILYSTTLQSQTSRIIWSGIWTACLWYTHFTGFFVSMLVVCALILLRPWRQALVESIGLHLVAAVLFLPYLPIFVKRFTGTAQHGTWLGPPDGLHSLWNMEVLFFGRQSVIYLGLLVLIITTLVSTRKPANSKPLVWLGILWIIGMPTAIWWLSFRMPLFLDRYLYFALLGLPILTAGLVESLPVSRPMQLGFGIAFALLFCSKYQLNQDNNRHLGKATAYVRQLQAQDSAMGIIVSSRVHQLGFVYHYDVSWFRLPDPERETGGLIFPVINRLAKQKEIIFINGQWDLPAGFLDQHPRIIWLDGATAFDHPNHNIASALAERFVRVQDTLFPEIHRVSVWQQIETQPGVIK
jgi:hypothetical protein